VHDRVQYRPNPVEPASVESFMVAIELIRYAALLSIYA